MFLRVIRQVSHLCIQIWRIHIAQHVGTKPGTKVVPKVYFLKQRIQTHCFWCHMTCQKGHPHLSKHGETISVLFELTIWANGFGQWFRLTIATIKMTIGHALLVNLSRVPKFALKGHTVHLCFGSAMQPHFSEHMLRLTNTWQSNKRWYKKQIGSKTKTICTRHWPSLDKMHEESCFGMRQAYYFEHTQGFVQLLIGIIPFRVTSSLSRSLVGF